MTTGGEQRMRGGLAPRPQSCEWGTNALIAALWERGDLGLAWATFERRQRSITEACDRLRELGTPDDVLEPILALVRKPTVAEADRV